MLCVFVCLFHKHVSALSSTASTEESVGASAEDEVIYEFNIIVRVG